MTDTNGGPAAMAEQDARGRRKFLTGGLAAGAAAVGAWSLTSAQPASADTGDNLIAGEVTQAGALTGLLMTADPYSAAAFIVGTDGQGPAIEGDNNTSGPGVKGTTFRGTGAANAGVSARSTTTWASACTAPPMSAYRATRPAPPRRRSA